MLLLSFAGHLALLSGLDGMTCVSGMVIIYITLQLELVAVTVEVSVAQMLKLHFSYKKVSVCYCR